MARPGKSRTLARANRRKAKRLAKVRRRRARASA